MMKKLFHFFNFIKNLALTKKVLLMLKVGLGKHQVKLNHALNMMLNYMQLK
jgi:hypothetical protein